MHSSTHTRFVMGTASQPSPVISFCTLAEAFGEGGGISGFGIREICYSMRDFCRFPEISTDFCGISNHIMAVRFHVDF